jgi:hypothetical protein
MDYLIRVGQGLTGAEERIFIMYSNSSVNLKKNIIHRGGSLVEYIFLSL